MDRNSFAFFSVSNKLPLEDMGVPKEHRAIGKGEMAISTKTMKNLLEESKIWKMRYPDRRIVEVCPLSKESPTVGFVSQISRVTVRLDDGSIIPLIVKLPELHSITNAMVETMGEEERYFMRENGDEELHSFLAGYYNAECEYYKSNHVNPKVMVPEVYSAIEWNYQEESEGVITMQDLSPVAVAGNFFDSITYGQVAAMLPQIACIQEHSLRHPAWRDSFQLSEGYMKFFAKFEKTVATWSRTNAQIGKLLENLLPFFGNYDFWSYIYRHSHKDLGIPNVLCHGDMWAYNILWFKNEDGTQSDRLCAILDWQNIHSGSCGEDFARMLVFCCDPDVRHAAEEKLFPIFHDFLTKECAAHDQPVPYTLAQLRSAYNRHLIAQALHLAFITKVMDCMWNRGDSEEQEKKRAKLEMRILSALEDANVMIDKELPQYRIRGKGAEVPDKTSPST